ncbi:MAG TPA: hypothetical protein VKB60_02990, partial [Terriglobales bacterium]|nr:hypothetical protein [Terriglobales bacterium]
MTQRLEGPGSTSSSLWLHSPAPNPPLRIGLLLDGPTLPRFNAEIIKHIQASNFANIELLVYRKGAVAATEKRGIPARLMRRLLDAKLRKHTIYDLYLQFDNKKKPQQHPRDMVDCS